MAVISSYSTLLTEVANWMSRSDLTADIPGFIQLWEEEFYNDPDNWGAWMETALSATIANNVAPVPADYLGLKIAYISGQVSAPLKRVSLDQLYQRYPRANAVSGTPVYIARNGSNFEFGPIAGDGTLSGTYYAKPTLLRDDSDGINYLITNEPHLCLCGSMAQAQLFVQNDKRNPVWQQKYEAALVAYRRRQVGEDYSGSPPHTVAV
jgi:hypothetical protein